MVFVVVCRRTCGNLDFSSNTVWKLRNMYKSWHCPGQVAQLVGESSRYAKVLGSIPGQGTYENHQ